MVRPIPRQPRCVMRGQEGRRAAGERRGGILALVPFLLVVLLAMAAMMIDLGYLTCVSSDLQNTADAASLAGALMARTGAPAGQVRRMAIQYADLNQPGVSTILRPSDVEVGRWSAEDDAFYPNDVVINAVRVTVRRGGNQSPKVGLFFAQLFGITEHEMEVKSMATFDTTFDNKEMIHSRPYILR